MLLTERANIVVIGGGLIGLSIAAKLSERSKGIFVLEKNSKAGQETSSRNSGVIHSGIHYPRGSLKATLSVRGNELLYDLCLKYRIPHKKLGKLTVAIGEKEIAEIERLKKQGEENGVPGLKMLEGKEAKELEPNLHSDRALLSPTSGIIEASELVNHYQSIISLNGAFVSTSTEVVGISLKKTGYELTCRAAGGEFNLIADTVINAAGLNSDKIAAMAGLDIDRLGYRLYYCKGDYFRIHGAPPIKHLVYPVPKGGGLGIHATPDLSGSVKIGPNAYYVDKLDYRVTTNVEDFRADVGRYLPTVLDMNIQEDSSGIRPKLQGPGDSFRDFVISEEADKGLSGFINLIGIESPGLTATPAIAELVSDIYLDKLK